MKENKGCLYVYLKYLFVAIIIMIASHYISGAFNISTDKWYYFPILLLPASAIAFVLFVLNFCTNLVIGCIIQNEKINYILSFIFTSCALLFTMSIEGNGGKDEKTDKEITVYICTGPNSEVFHKYSDCKGLSRCSGDVIQVPLDDVIRYRRPCKICY